MDADLQVQALVLALGAEIARRFAHADRGGNGAIIVGWPPAILKK